MIQSLAEVETAILQTLVSALPGVTVLFYPAYAVKLALPCVVIELASFREESGPANGQYPLIARYEARCVVAPELPGAQAAVRDLALLVARITRFQTWGILGGIGAAQPDGEVAEDGFKPELENHLVWLVPWTHHIAIGQPDEFATAAILPEGGPVRFADYPDSLRTQVENSHAVETLLLGVYPSTGAGNEAKYWDVQQDPPDGWPA